MSKVVDLASHRECQHVWEDGEIPGGGSVKVCTKCGLGYATDDGDTIMEKAVAKCGLLQEENDRLRAGIRGLIEHHRIVAGEEKDRVDAMPVTEPMRERLIGKTKVRSLIATKLEELLTQQATESESEGSNG